MLDFGEYAPFIWASYGLTAVVLIALAVHTFKGRK